MGAFLLGGLLVVLVEVLWLAAAVWWANREVASWESWEWTGWGP